MKWIGFVFFYVLGQCCLAQVDTNDYRTGVLNRLKAKKIYIFARGTTSKSRLISHAFNYADTNISHIGIGYKKAGRLYIYNVVDNGNETTSALIIDSLASFIGGKEVFYFSVWECSSNKKESKRFVAVLKAAVKKKISFDPFFQLEEDESWYCSEFCYKILEETSPRRFACLPRTIYLENEVYQKILDRKVLSYFPVDFFQQIPCFKKAYEFRFR